MPAVLKGQIQGMLKKFVVSVLFLILFSIGLGACVSVGASPTSQGGIEINQAVVRLPGTSMAEMGSEIPLAGYMQIKNIGLTDDTLLGIQADFAEEAMLHETSVDDNGVASMKMVMSIEILAGQVMELKPGSFHAMFSGLKQSLNVGDTVTLTLQFKNAGSVSVLSKVISQ
jgi:copper(I)-binding protein